MNTTNNSSNVTLAPETAGSRGHAVVLGGSMAGLVTARILSERFARVTVIERDSYPQTPGPRRGVPQGKHIHIVLARGRETLERLFPTFASDLEQAGAVTFDYGRGAALHFGDSALAPFDSELVVRGCTRPLLDFHIHKYVHALPNVTVREGYKAVGLVVAPDDGTVVTGVRVKRDEEPEEIVSADLIVDASGRASRAETWLEEIGYARPEETTVDSGLTYACRPYVPRDRAPWAVLTAMPRAPHQPRSAAIFAVEGDRWLVCIASMGEDRPPTEDPGYLEFTRSLSSPVIYEALKTAVPDGPVIRSGTTQNRLRHYERLSRLPDGFVLLGDAVCALNPLYGQGITVGTLAAVALGDAIDAQRARESQGDDAKGFSLRFQKQLAKQNRSAWMRATGADSGWPNTRSVPAKGPLEQWLGGLTQRAATGYAARVMDAAVRDPAVAKTMMEISHMQRSMSAMLNPQFIYSSMNRGRGNS